MQLDPRALAFALTLAAPASAQSDIIQRGAAANEPSTELAPESWRNNPRIKAVEERVAQLDKNKPRGVPTHACHTSHTHLEAEAFLAETVSAIPPPPEPAKVLTKRAPPPATH